MSKEKWSEIAVELTKLYSSLPYVIAVYGRNVGGIRDLLFVCDSDNPSFSPTEIFDRTLILEEKFPRITFDYLVLDKNEMNYVKPIGRVLLYSR
jgi:hypothetical protein